MGVLRRLYYVALTKFDDLQGSLDAYFIKDLVI